MSEPLSDDELLKLWREGKLVVQHCTCLSDEDGMTSDLRNVLDRLEREAYMDGYNDGRYED